MSDGASEPADPVADGRPSGAWSPSSGLVGLAWACAAAALAWCAGIALVGYLWSRATFSKRA